jgi:hypothetical protein
MMAWHRPPSPTRAEVKRKSTATPLLPLWASMPCPKVDFTFTIPNNTTYDKCIKNDLYKIRIIFFLPRCGGYKKMTIQHVGVYLCLAERRL